MSVNIGCLSKEHSSKTLIPQEKMDRGYWFLCVFHLQSDTVQIAFFRFVIISVNDFLATDKMRCFADAMWGEESRRQA